MVLLPEMEDVITLIQTQGSTIAPLGEEINYNEIKLSMSAWGAGTGCDNTNRTCLDFLEQDGLLRANSLQLILHIVKAIAALGLCRAHRRFGHTRVQKVCFVVKKKIPAGIFVYRNRVYTLFL